MSFISILESTTEIVASILEGRIDRRVYFVFRQLIRITSFENILPKKDVHILFESLDNFSCFRRIIYFLKNNYDNDTLHDYIYLHVRTS